MEHLFNLTNIATGLAVTLIGILIIGGVRWVVNQGPTATNNQRLKELLDTNERVMAEMVARREELEDDIGHYRSEQEAMRKSITRLTLQNNAQQARIELIEAMYTQETGKVLPPMVKVGWS